MEAIETGPVNHRVECFTLPGFFRARLDFDLHTEIEPADWLTFGEQRLRSIVAGDCSTTISAWQMSGYASRTTARCLALHAGIGLAAHRPGGAPDVAGRLCRDEIGSTIIAGRLVRDVMRLCFLMERQYAPYPKWFGTAFMRLAAGPELAQFSVGIAGRNVSRTRRSPGCGVRISRGQAQRAGHHGDAQHNALAVLDAAIPSYLGDRFADAIVARIADPAVRRIAERGQIGSLDQFSDSTDLLSPPEWRQAVRGLYV